MTDGTPRTFHDRMDTMSREFAIFGHRLTVIERDQKPAIKAAVVEVLQEREPIVAEQQKNRILEVLTEWERTHQQLDEERLKVMMNNILNSRQTDNDARQARLVKSIAAKFGLALLTSGTATAMVWAYVLGFVR